jgi:hypothetical protein
MDDAAGAQFVQWAGRRHPVPEAEEAAEFVALRGHGSAVEIAMAWVEAVLVDQDAQRMWELATPGLRRMRAEQWIRLNGPRAGDRDHDELAGALAASSTDPAWPAFAQAWLNGTRAAWRDVELITWGYTTGQVAGIDRETVFVVEMERRGRITLDRTPRRAIALTLEHGESGWRVAGTDATRAPQTKGEP